MIFSLQLYWPVLLLFPNAEQGHLCVRQIITGNISEINVHDICLSGVVPKRILKILQK